MPRPALFAFLLAAQALVGCLDGGDEVGDVRSLDPLTCMQPCMRDVDREGFSWEPHLAISPLDPDHLVIASNRMGPEAFESADRWGFAHVSRNGGVTWQTVRLPGGPDAPDGHPLRGATQMFDPVVMFLADGTLLYLTGTIRFEVPFVEAPQGSGQAGIYHIEAADLVMLRSHDGGLTYPDDGIRIIAEGAGALVGAWASTPQTGTVGAGSPPVAWTFHDKPWMTADGEGGVLVTWSEVVVNQPTRSQVPQRGLDCDLLHAYSADGGLSWGQSTIVSDSGEVCDVWGVPAVLSDGTWLVAFQSGGDVHLARSEDAGRTWTKRPVVEEHGRPALQAHDGPGGPRLWLVTAGKATDEDMRVPALRWSDDHGKTWSDPLVLDEPEAPGSVWPAMAVGAQGTVWVSFYHPHGTDRAPEAQYRVAVVENERLLDQLILDDAYVGSTMWGGHYHGVVAIGDSAHAAWVHFDGSQGDLVTAKVDRQP